VPPTVANARCWESEGGNLLWPLAAAGDHRQLNRMVEIIVTNESGVSTKWSARWVSSGSRLSRRQPTIFGVAALSNSFTW
jgi:hypothetical protein